MPDFQNDGFALFDRQFGQTAHGRAFLRRFARRRLEPAARFQFAREPAPQAAAMVQRAVAKASDAIMIGLRRRLAPLQQRHERLLQNVLRFAVAQPQRPAVENQLRGFRFVKALAPIWFGFPAHSNSLNRHQSGPICIKNLARNRLCSWPAPGNKKPGTNRLPASKFGSRSKGVLNQHLHPKPSTRPP